VVAALTDQSAAQGKTALTSAVKTTWLGYQHEITVMVKGWGTSASKTRTTDRLIWMLGYERKCQKKFYTI
jgi:hypothetical protein